MRLAPRRHKFVIDPDRGRRIAWRRRDEVPYFTMIERSPRQQKAAGCNAFSRLPGERAKL
jgi:hypothetical protein